MTKPSKERTSTNGVVDAPTTPGTSNATAVISDEERKQMTHLAALMLAHANSKKVPDAAMEEIKKGLQDYPRLWRVLGDMAAQTRFKIISQHTAGPIADEAMHKGYNEMQKAMGYDEAPILEKLLIEQVLLCWLQMYVIQYLYEANTGANHSLRMGEYWEKRLTATQKRYLRAIETLAKVRKMGPKVLMLNVAQQQINAAFSE